MYFFTTVASRRCGLLFLLLILAGAARAQLGEPGPMPEQPAPYEFRLTEASFEEAYGFNDTARAVIRLYYSKWNTGRRIMQFAGYPVPLVSAVGRHMGETTTSSGVIVPNAGTYYYDPWVAPVAFSLLGVSAFGLGKATAWNRRQLYTAIRQYRLTHKLPAQVTARLLAPYLQAVQQDGYVPLPTAPAAVPPRK
ncbi:hypothetical protein [Hymenobacter pini]|uniref:hypothetical protein n=1 Tax=Hymenobacter pini TaxID=2880879 RepID=UPI001CF17903|nr:hypothetical protein [Hymenobacter pini]MCA8832624.1 hypothetical protein [Hymenobacter pini]